MLARVFMLLCPVPLAHQLITPRPISEAHPLKLLQNARVQVLGHIPVFQGILCRLLRRRHRGVELAKLVREPHAYFERVRHCGRVYLLLRLWCVVDLACRKGCICYEVGWGAVLLFQRLCISKPRRCFIQCCSRWSPPCRRVLASSLCSELGALAGSCRVLPLSRDGATVHFYTLTHPGRR